METKKQNEQYKYLNDEIEAESRKLLKQENESWQKIIGDLKVQTYQLSNY